MFFCGGGGGSVEMHVRGVGFWFLCFEEVKIVSDFFSFFIQRLFFKGVDL